MNYKELIYLLLEKASTQQLKRLYHFIKQYLGRG